MIKKKSIFIGAALTATLLVGASIGVMNMDNYVISKGAINEQILTWKVGNEGFKTTLNNVIPVKYEANTFETLLPVQKLHGFTLEGEVDKAKSTYQLGYATGCAEMPIAYTKANALEGLTMAFNEGKEPSTVKFNNVTLTKVEFTYSCVDNGTSLGVSNDYALVVNGNVVENATKFESNGNHAAFSIDLNAGDKLIALDKTGKALGLGEGTNALFTAKGTAKFNVYINNKDDVYIQAVEVPTVDALYLQPNVWKADNARFAAYLKKNDGNIEKWIDLTKVNEDIYKLDYPKDIAWDFVIFCRMNPNNKDNNWDNKYNQTGDIYFTDLTHKNLIQITGWDKPHALLAYVG